MLVHVNIISAKSIDTLAQKVTSSNDRKALNDFVSSIKLQTIVTRNNNQTLRDFVTSIKLDNGLYLDESNIRELWVRSRSVTHSSSINQECLCEITLSEVETQDEGLNNL